MTGKNIPQYRNSGMGDDHPSLVMPHLIWVEKATPNVDLAVTSRLEVTHELRQLGWRVTLVLAGPAGQRSVRGIAVLCIPTPKLFFLGYCLFHLRLFSILAREWATTDVILFHTMSAPWILPLRLARCLTGKRLPLLVMDTRDITAPSHYSNKPGFNLKGRLASLFDSWAHRLADRWADGQTAITQRMVNLLHISSRQLLGIWPSGVNLARFVPGQTARRWPSTGDAIQLVYTGVMVHERNLLPLCRAVEQANTEGMAFILSLIGDGVARVDLEKFALQTAGRIRIVQTIPHDEIPRWLTLAHIGVTSIVSSHQEVLDAANPIKLFEYMASGLPVLASRRPCYTDVVGDGDYVFWVENADADGLLASLRQVWRNRDLLSEMGRKAAAAAQAWTWHESARKLKTSLEHGLSNRH